MAKYTEGNRLEIPDPTPVEMPIGYHHPETLQAMIARMVRFESDRAKEHGLETFEESDDFDVDDDSEIVSPYQMSEMQEEFVHRKEETDEHASDVRQGNAESATGSNGRKAEKSEKKQEVKPSKKMAPKAKEVEPESEGTEEQ